MKFYKTVPYTEVENADESDVGKMALIQADVATLCIEESLDECLETARRLDFDTRDDDEETGSRPINESDIKTSADMQGDLVAVWIGPADAE